MERFNRPSLIVVFTALITLQLKGCVENATLAVADEVAWVALAYCMAPAELRGKFRQVIDANTAPNRVRVECAADAL
jgi:hypothetical protein